MPKFFSSVYLDDRNVAAPCPLMLQNIMEHSGNYDKLISSKLNESKCQLYFTAAIDVEEVEEILPQATRTRRPWSLGFALPVRNAVGGEEDICEAEMKCEARMQVAKQTALKAKVLPHDMRVRVLATVHASQWQHGREFCKLKAADGNRLLRDLEESLWGTTRRARSSAIMWTVLYKGHCMRPESVCANRCIKFIRTVAKYCNEAAKNTFLELCQNHNVGDENQVTVAYDIFRKCGWTWHEPFKLKIYDYDGERVVDIEEDDWPELKHNIRAAMRYNLLQDEALHQRWDLRGLRGGVDYEKTRSVLESSVLSWLQKGMLRTIMCGAVWTPSRMMKASLLTANQAECVHCNSGAVESLGHKFWYCPKWAQIRQNFDCQDFNEASWPRCLTRCGICPSGLPLEAKRICQIQKMMVSITATAAKCPEAQKQFKAASRDGKRAVSALALQFALAGN